MAACVMQQVHDKERSYFSALLMSFILFFVFIKLHI